MSDLPKQYSPKDHEEAIYKQWEEAGVFQPNEEALAAGRKPFVIMLPPPNITGSLHMGHALQDTIMDVLSRWHRMQGDPTLWLPGTDHAAIATNRVLEKQLQAEGINKKDITRENFLERAQDWYDKTGAIIIDQMKKLGCSCDWSRSRFTMDTEYVRSVNETFIQYYSKGYIYRGNRIVSWCANCVSVISDLEIKYEQRSTKLITVTYSLSDGTGDIEVATTRPETMLGDTAVAVHPEDDRYIHMVGKKVTLPITGREVPIVGDARIDPKFGTGAVKITPAHDPLDAEIGLTHKLPILNVITEEGFIEGTNTEFDGLTTKDAREKIIDVLAQDNRIVSMEDHKHNASLCDRCGSVIEPLISRQWFVDMSKLKDETVEVAKNEVVRFNPPRWKNHFLDWMDNVHDWTISRQIWLGHQIPVWWKPGTRGSSDEEGNFIVSSEKPEGDWEKDPDVLDTWFSSALWPFATLGWPDSTSDLENFYPTSVLVTGRDIMYLWVARMIFSGLELMQGSEYGNRDQTKRIPFEDVLIHPTVLTKEGQRMSKSLGTGIDPLELIKEYGADATRFGLMYQMNYDRQAIKFDEQVIKTSRNFGNKIWNIARLLLSLPDKKTEEGIADKWISQKADRVTEEVTNLLKEYKIGEAARLVHEFVWKDFADWYIEILKVEGSTQVGKEVFKRILQLIHPFMPHVTEVLWQHFDATNKMITVSAWPQANVSTDVKVEETMVYFQDLVNTVRSARTLLNIKPGSMIEIDPQQDISLKAALVDLCRAKVNELEATKENVIQFALQGGQVVSLFSEEVTDDSIVKAKARLNKEKSELATEIDKQKGILEKMIGRAPQDKVEAREKMIVEKEGRLMEIERSLKLFS